MAKSASSRSASGSLLGWWIVLAIVTAIGVAAWVYREPIAGYTGVSTAYSARVACSCRFVAGRSLEDCAKDKLAGMELVTLTENVDDKSVTARFPLLSETTASHREGYGCVLEAWES